MAKARVLTRKLGNRIDNEEVFEGRYIEFCMNNPCIVDHYREMGILLQVCPPLGIINKVVDSKQVDTSQESSLSYLTLANALKDLHIWQSMQT
jgi:hypothetical protein